MSALGASVGALALLISSFAAIPDVAAAAVPEEPGFVEDVVWSGLTRPTAVRFATDGRAFVAEKSGRIKAFDNVDDPTPTITADLSGNVHDYWDRGLLGLAIDPSFPSNPYLYVLYTLDAGNSWNDQCPNPPGPTNDGCVVDGRLSRLQVDPATNTQVGGELVLLEGLWCQQYPSHSIGGLAFTPDGALIATAGDGASFSFTDYGQGGGDAGSPTPVNPCGDPDPTPGAGGEPTLPDAEGGALRSQDILTMSDPVSLDGTVIRIDPATGNAHAGNPLLGGDPGDDRIIAYGLRNPFRLTVRPGTNEVWTGDVGKSAWEEINRIVDPTDAVVENFGWPCYEGNGRQTAFDGLDVDLCEDLYDGTIASDLTAPYLPISHGTSFDPTECPGGGASTSGLAFYESGHYPSTYDGALFFADYSWRCVWVMYPDAGGDPDPGQIDVFVSSVGVVDLTTGPGGDLFITEFDAGQIIRVTFPAGNGGPTAVIDATPTSGVAPLSVQFDGSNSIDPEGDFLRYDWDLDGDGTFGDSNAVAPSYEYTTAGQYLVQLEVEDDFGATDIETVVIDVTPSANTPPTATISSPDVSFEWFVGETIPFSGGGTDAEDGTLAPSALEWQLDLHHCNRTDPTDCHVHTVETRSGVASGDFVAPDHEYPSHLEVVLTVTDSGGLTDQVAVAIQPETVDLTVESVPAGLDLTAGTVTGATPFTETFIVGSMTTLSAPSPQSPGGTTYVWDSWSDGGARSHDITAPATPTTYTATYVEPACGGLVQEGESGVAVGSFAVTADAAASGGQYVGAPQGSGNSFTFDPSNGVEFCVTVPTTGTYELRATVQGPNGGSNSFWVRVDGVNESAMFFPAGATYVDRAIDTFQLTAGDHTIGIYLREHGAKLDLIQLVGDGPPPNLPPTAVISADQTSGTAPLTVQFDGSGSSDPETGPLTYDWDLDGDGNFGDSSAEAPSFIYTSDGTFLVQLRVTDDQGNQDTDTVPIFVGSGSCGGLVQEGESGVVFGSFAVAADATASGGQYVGAPEGSGSTYTFDPSNGVEFCVTVPTTGTYELRATVDGPNEGANSFWVRVDGVNESAMFFPAAAGYTDRAVDTYQLTAGDHTIGIYLREHGAKLDLIQLVQVG